MSLSPPPKAPGLSKGSSLTPDRRSKSLETAPRITLLTGTTRYDELASFCSFHLSHGLIFRPSCLSPKTLSLSKGSSLAPDRRLKRLETAPRVTSLTGTRLYDELASF